MITLIEGFLPESWRDLEVKVAQILRECGYDVDVQKTVQLARGNVDIDVWADDHSSPPSVIAVECKHWSRRATKNVVHAFRAVVGDSGANIGLIVSSAGFQKGAIEAATYSNVRLLTWDEFQVMFSIRWFMRHMSPTLAERTDALHEYTEPINSRVFNKADALSPELREKFKVLREQYWPLAALNFVFHPVFYTNLVPTDVSPFPELPLRGAGFRPFGTELTGLVPDDVLDATALRPLMDALIEHSCRATAEFDAVFGERA